MGQPIIVCVGGPRGKNKMDFIRQWTRPDNRGSQDHSMCYSVLDGAAIVFDTPTERHRRNLQDDQCAEGIFKAASCILDFGDWDLSEVHEWQTLVHPVVIPQFGNPMLTMKRILQRHGINVPVHPPVVRGDPDGTGVVGDHVPADAQDAESTRAERSDDLSDGDRLCTSASFGGSVHE